MQCNPLRKPYLAILLSFYVQLTGWLSLNTYSIITLSLAPGVVLSGGKHVI